MLYTDMTKKAMRIAFDAHIRQTDKSGLPYIFHPYHLAEQMNDEASICAALLHDVVEDTSVSFAELASQGISPMVIETLKLLTHDKSVPYLDYVRKIKESGNPAAIAVKLADLRHNSDTTRMNTADHRVGGTNTESADRKTSERVAKYKAAIDILEQNDSSSKIVIEKEAATGFVRFVLRVGESVYCVSDNLAPMPRSYAEPMQTYDAIHTKALRTTKDPSYKDITILPGMILQYPVFDGEGSVPIANMKVTIQSGAVLSPAYEYHILNENGTSIQLLLDTTKNGPIDSTFLEQIPPNGIAVSVYPDRSFVYNSLSIIEERYIVSMNEEHMPWLHHVFHAFILRRYAL